MLLKIIAVFITNLNVVLSVKVVLELKSEWFG